MKKLIDVYVYRMNSGRPEFLLLLRAKKKIYANQWRMIGGKVKGGESHWEGALREIKEELGLRPDEFWVIPSVNIFYEAETDQIHQIPAFAALLSGDVTLTLNDEHTTYQWVTVDEIDAMLAWPEQKRLIRLTNEIINHDLILPEWRIKTT